MSETRRLVFLDFETTGLHHLAQPFEIAWLPEHLPPAETRSLILPHTLYGADPEALVVNRYRERQVDQMPICTPRDLDQLREEITGVCLVIANPVFDIPYLLRILGFQVWHHRILDIESYAAAFFGLPNPPGMKQLQEMLVARGYPIPEPDHTAAGDVIAMRAMHNAMMRIPTA